MKLWIPTVLALAFGTWFCFGDRFRLSKDGSIEPKSPGSADDRELQKAANIVDIQASKKEALDPQVWECIKKTNAERTRRGEIRDAQFAADMREWNKRLHLQSPPVAKLSEVDVADMLPLLNSWGLSSEAVAQINSLISGRNRKLEALLTDRLAESDPAKVQASRLEASRLESDADKALRAILGDEKHAQLDMWQKAKDERRILSAFDSQLQAAGIAINLPQKQSIMDAMYQARQSVLNGSRLAAAPLLRDKMAASRQEVMRLAAPTLSKQQQDALNEYLRTQLGGE
jgi:hypothetical protein